MKSCADVPYSIGTTVQAMVPKCPLRTGVLVCTETPAIPFFGVYYNISLYDAIYYSGLGRVQAIAKPMALSHMMHLKFQDNVMTSCETAKFRLAMHNLRF